MASQRDPKEAHGIPKGVPKGTPSSYFIKNITNGPHMARHGPKLRQNDVQGTTKLFINMTDQFDVIFDQKSLPEAAYGAEPYF